LLDGEIKCLGGAVKDAQCLFSLERGEVVEFIELYYISAARCFGFN
jgi:hypothetical protein